MAQPKVLSPEEREIEDLKRLRARAIEISQPFLKDLDANEETKGSTVYNVHNVWVIKPHHFTERGPDLRIK